ncbi:MAG TPA: matrixin family metalloprotease [Solirubrobacteraceae bacterium]|jgi:hypothetical protein|nr:matrixin family metalloprotease [Solirubrobacteraceae bacterium]
MFPKRIATVASTVALSALALAPPASADAEVRPDLRPGDVVSDHGAGAVVPPPGYGVYAETTLASGGAQTLGVLTERDGTVIVSGAGSEAVEPLPPVPPLPGLPESPPPPCEDGAYHRMAWTLSDGSRKFAKWKSVMNWWFNPAGVPADLDRVRARESVRRAARNIVTGRNDCGMPDQITATHTFQGDTSTAAGITRDGMCAGAYDSKNVVAFGSLGARSEQAVAVACVWVVNDGGTYLSMVDTDVKVNTDYRWYTDEPPTICLDSRYSVEGVMTHEFGHAYGLDHVDEAEHGNLTMSTNVNMTCGDDQATLGKGDVWGLQALY